MNQINSPSPRQFARVRALLAAAPLVLILTGHAAAESHGEPESEAVAVAAAKSGLETASQPGRERASRVRAGRERMAHRFDRRSSGVERHARRGARRHDGSGLAGLWFGRRIVAELNLSDEQRDQLRATMREISDDRRASRRQVADARRSFERAARDPDRTAEDVRALGEALGRVRADQALQWRSERARIAGILTEEQHEQLDEMRERRRSRANNRRRRG